MSSTDDAIRDRLVAHGQKIFDAPKGPIEFTNNEPADALLKDFKCYPHAFVLACVMDQQIKAERAWLIPYKISQQLGGFTMTILKDQSLADIKKVMREPEPLHRFVDKMSVFFHEAVQRIDEQYGGDASKIWNGMPSSAEVVLRFLQFKGVGPKIASMATNILARRIKIPMSDYSSIDISADVHVRRVFSRLGLCADDASADIVIDRARSLYPQFPGMMDFPCWEIGRTWCMANRPKCEDCYMHDLCPGANM